MMTQTNSKPSTRTPDAGEECTCCKRLLKNQCMELEYNQDTSTYHVGDVPEGSSLGFFSFGMACGRKVLKNGGRV